MTHLPTPFEVSANEFIERLAKRLKEGVGEISPPEWSRTAKTSSHRELPPHDPDWWYRRCASLLRKLYVHGTTGVSRLRLEYGGRRRRGRQIEHSRIGGASSVRDPLQQLEKAGLVAKVEAKGRRLTAEGKNLLDQVATDLLKETPRRASLA